MEEVEDLAEPVVVETEKIVQNVRKIKNKLRR